MKKKLIFAISIIGLLLVSGCVPGSNQTTDYQKNLEGKSDFCLYSKTETIELNTDISKVKMEPISVEYGSGDGFKWTESKYEDVEIKTLTSDDGKSMINKISTKSSSYETTRGIRVGDNITKLEDLYKESLIFSESVESCYYLYDPEDDIGFKKIYFYIKNNTINMIVIEDSIDG